MKFAILADDLTGALAAGSVLCSISGIGRVATVELDNLREVRDSYDCVCINIGTREQKYKHKVERILEVALKSIGEKCSYALRIDGLFRGPIGTEIAYILKRKNVILTDTVPEFGRFTRDMKVKLPDKMLDLTSLVERLNRIGSRYGHMVTVADSRTYEDLKRLAVKCVHEDAVPVDPGPFIAYVAREVIG